VRLLVAEEHEACVLRLGVLDRGALDALLLGSSPAHGRARTALVPLDRGRALLRPLRRGGLLGPLLGGAILGASRPFAELEVTARLRGAGAPVPAPVFALAERRLGPVHRAAVATVFEEGATDALRFLEAAPACADLQAAASAAGAAVRRFHDAGGRHRDLHVKNLLLEETPQGGFRALVIDLDGAHLGGPPTAAERMRELMRLHRSLVKRGVAERVGARGLARFLSAYVAGDRALRRRLLRELPRELRRLRWHALGYRLRPAPRPGSSAEA
jgi:tRNA A-37 threonylcarbamoyl transferase component Bud32